MENGFYKDKYFQQLSNEIAEVKQEVKEMRTELASLTTKVNYIYAWAAGVGSMAAFITNYVMK